VPEKPSASQAATSVDELQFDDVRLERDRDNSVHAVDFPEHAKKLGLTNDLPSPPNARRKP
jgi:hypothetical protein